MTAASAVGPLTLYTAKICPWAQRATMALHEVGAQQVEYIEIDLKNKPTWYSNINPALKVPVLQLGSQSHDATDPSPKIPESNVILELVSDLYPGQLLPEHDPVRRAEERYFIERFHQVVSQPYFSNLLHGARSPESAKCCLAGMREIQSLLARHQGKYAFGDKVTMADCAVAPFVGRIMTTGRAGLLTDDLFKTLNDTDKDDFAVFRSYAEALADLESFKATFDEQLIVSVMKEKSAAARDAAAKDS